MEESAELNNYLPLSIKSPKEQEYIEFLWVTFWGSPRAGRTYKRSPAETHTLQAHDILKKRTYLAKFCLLHLGTDPSMDLALSFAEWVRMTT